MATFWKYEMGDTIAVMGKVHVFCKKLSLMCIRIVINVEENVVDNHSLNTTTELRTMDVVEMRNVVTSQGRYASNHRQN